METLKLFGKSLKLPINAVQSFSIAKICLAKGYIVDPDCLNTEVVKFVEDNAINLGSSFYKSWDDVLQRDRVELYLDQIRHYESTYGTDFKGVPWVPHEFQSLANPPKFISSISDEEAITRACVLIYSNVALSQETIELVLGLFNRLNFTPDLKQVKNREALVILYKLLDMVPDEVDQFIRLLVYTATGQTLVIKNNSTITAIKESQTSVIALLQRFTAKKLAPHFNRYKDLLLAFKCSETKTFLNKVGRLSKKLHQPKKPSISESFLTLPNPDASGLTNFQKIRIIEKIWNDSSAIKLYPIRNGKMWIENRTTEVKDYSIHERALINSLITELSKKACKVYLPDDFLLVCPTSEKNFVGGFPMNSAFRVPDKNLVMGIYWKESDGARDLDLSLVDDNGYRLGWNAAYYDNSFTYSGDMTSANPDAVEMFHMNNVTDKRAIMKVNKFRGEFPYKYSVFVGSHGKASKKMIDHNNVLMMGELTFTRKESIVGMLEGSSTGSIFKLFAFETSDKRISNKDLTSLLIERYKNYKSVNLQVLLVAAGFTFVQSPNEADIDFTKPSKDTFINLFTT